MRSNLRFMLMSLAAVTAGCGLEGDGDTKNSCNVQSDCLNGFDCVGATCVPSDDDDGVVPPDGPSGGALYGTVQPFTPQSTGFAAANYDSLVGVTNAAGTLGCAVVGDLSAAPGSDVAAVYAKIYDQGGDRRCLAGTFAIMNDPATCTPSYFDDLRPGCALYKRWDANGTQVANQIAIGGYISVQQTYVNDSSYRCTTELNIRFPGNVTVAKTFQFTYNPLAAASAFCVH